MNSRSNSTRYSAGAKQLVASRLKELLQESDRSATSVAIESGISPSGFLRILNGSSDPKLGTLLAIAKTLQLGSIEELLAPLGTSVALKREAEGRAEEETR